MSIPLASQGASSHVAWIGKCVLNLDSSRKKAFHECTAGLIQEILFLCRLIARAT